MWARTMASGFLLSSIKEQDGIGSIKPILSLHVRQDGESSGKIEIMVNE
jgi:hypothetical protein